MRGVCKGVEIKGILSVVPSNVIANIDYFEKFGDHRIKKQIQLTGIRNRRVCGINQTATDLAVVAAQKLIDSLNWDKNSISVLIYVTQSPELSRPATAFLIHSALNLDQDCLVYDINMGCAGYIGGIETISSLLSSYGGRGILLVGESHAKEDGEINTSTLLNGDAASATALEYTGYGDMIVRHFSDGKRSNLLYKAFNKQGFMDGNAVFLFGLNDVVRSIVKFREDNNLGDDDIDYYVFHQAQKMMVEGISQGAGLDSQKVLMSCGDYGNTSSVSIPLTINVNLQQNSEDIIRLLLCGFGIGLSWGIIYMTIKRGAIFSLVESNDEIIDRSWYEI